MKFVRYLQGQWPSGSPRTYALFETESGERYGFPVGHVAPGSEADRKAGLIIPSGYARRMIEGRPDLTAQLPDALVRLGG